MGVCDSIKCLDELMLHGIRETFVKRISIFILLSGFQDFKLHRPLLICILRWLVILAVGLSGQQFYFSIYAIIVLD